MPAARPRFLKRSGSLLHLLLHRLSSGVILQPLLKPLRIVLLTAAMRARSFVLAARRTRGFETKPSPQTLAETEARGDGAPGGALSVKQRPRIL